VFTHIQHIQANCAILTPSVGITFDFKFGADHHSGVFFSAETSILVLQIDEFGAVFKRGPTNAFIHYLLAIFLPQQE
jgi:hypothetical protein